MDSVSLSVNCSNSLDASEIVTSHDEKCSSSSSACALQTSSVSSCASTPLSLNPPHSLKSKKFKGVEVFVGDISFFCSDVDLFQLFSSFGRVLRARVKKSDKDGRTLMYGFVDMEHESDARAAVSQLDGHRFQGRNIRVEIGGTKTKTKKSQRSESSTPDDVSYQFYVAFSSVENASTDRILLPTETLLRQVFEQFAPVKDVAIKYYRYIESAHRQQGFCFVAFYLQNDARVAYQMVHGKAFFDFVFHCSLSYHNPLQNVAPSVNMPCDRDFANADYYSRQQYPQHLQFHHFHQHQQTPDHQFVVHHIPQTPVQLENIQQQHNCSQRLYQPSPHPGVALQHSQIYHSNPSVDIDISRDSHALNNGITSVSLPSPTHPPVHLPFSTQPMMSSNSMVSPQVYCPPSFFATGCIAPSTNGQDSTTTPLPSFTQLSPNMMQNSSAASLYAMDPRFSIGGPNSFMVQPLGVYPYPAAGGYPYGMLPSHTMMPPQVMPSPTNNLTNSNHHQHAMHGNSFNSYPHPTDSQSWIDAR